MQTTSAFTAPCPTKFFRVSFRLRFYEPVDAFQADLDAWLVHDNTERRRLGYRDHGKRPIDTVTDHPGSLQEESVA